MKSTGKISSIDECFSNSQIGLLLAIAFADAMDGAILGSTFKVLESELGLSPSGLAIMALLQSLGGKLAAPFWGWACDEAVVSRKTLMMGGCMGWATCMAALGLSYSLWQLYLVRALNGVFLACLMPLSQSWVSDLAHPEAFGRIFGLMGLAGGLGGALFGGMTTSMSAELFLGLSGWRFMCFVVGAFSWMLAGAIWFFMEVGPVADSRGNPHNPFTAIAQVFSNLVSSMRIPTFNVIIAQGILGCMPWTSLSFEVMYFQYLGFSNERVGLYQTLTGIFGMPGMFVGGLVGDFLMQKFGDHGRPLTAQLSVGLGIPFFVLFIYVLPETIGTKAIWPYIISKSIFALVASWCLAGVNRPILSEIVPKSSRASIMAWDLCIEQFLSSAIALPLVGILSEKVFGYQPTTLAVAEMPAAQREMNAMALRNTLVWMGVVPWTLCFILFSGLHFTYPKDRAAMIKETEGEGAVDEEKASLVKNAEW